jgi:hypothetical protein
VEKYSKAKHAIDDYTIWRMLTARWIIEATNTTSEYVTLFACPVEYDSGQLE